MARQGTIVETFRGIFRPFRCQKIPIAPYQHPTLAARLEKSGSTAPSPLPVRRFHIHSKTACRGFESFCPCHKTGRNTAFLPVFFLHVLYGYGVHAGSDSGFSHPFASARTCFHPLQHPKRTLFRLFLAFPGAFRCFFSFDLQNFPYLFCSLCHLALKD